MRDSILHDVRDEPKAAAVLPTFMLVFGLVKLFSPRANPDGEVWLTVGGLVGLTSFFGFAETCGSTVYATHMSRWEPCSSC